MPHRFAVAIFLLLLAIVVMTASQVKNGGPQSGIVEHEVNRPTLPSGVKKRRIVVIGAHPEDPVFGCGGLIARLTQAGHEVIVAYTTCHGGNRKVGSLSEAEIRRHESAASSKVLGATLHVFDYDHNEPEALMADKATLDAVSTWFKEVKPDIVVTHWPVDAQAQHHVTSSLVWLSYLRDREKRWSLYFFEVLNDRQTIAFKPDLFLDIGDVKDIKREACFCHQSQTPQGFWSDHEDMHKLRGEECGVRYAEAYTLAELLPGRAQLPVLLPSHFMNLKKKK